MLYRYFALFSGSMDYTTPLGLKKTCPLTQGSGADAATLGYDTESRWDSQSMKTDRDAY